MRIVIVTALWKRHDVTRIFWAGIERVRALWEHHGLEVEVVAVGSTDPVHSQMATEAGASYLDYPDNDCLGGKLNTGFRFARFMQPDYVLKFDSDDLLGNACALAYVDAFHRAVPYIGLRGCHFYNLPTGEAKWWAGYERTEPESLGGAKANTHLIGEPVGVARAFHRIVLGYLRWAPWEPSLTRNLDGCVTKRLAALGAVPTLVEHTGVAVDIKSDVNLGTYEHMPGEPADISDWVREFSPAELTGLTLGLQV